MKMDSQAHGQQYMLGFKVMAGFLKREFKPMATKHPEGKMMPWDSSLSPASSPLAELLQSQAPGKAEAQESPFPG